MIRPLRDLRLVALLLAVHGATRWSGALMIPIMLIILAGEL